MTKLLRYVERCTGASHNGDAWIGYAETSKSGRTVYFNGRAFGRATGGGVSGNHYDVESGEEYWISGVKKRGTNRHWAGSGPIRIESIAVAEYLDLTGSSEIDTNVLEVVPLFPETDKDRIRELLNEPLDLEDDAG